MLTRGQSKPRNNGLTRLLLNQLIVHGYLEYQLIWGVPAVGEELNCNRELSQFNQFPSYLPSYN